MSKGRYCTQNFQAWFSKKSYERFGGQELVVAVDAAKVAFYAAVMSAGWRKFDILYFEQDNIAEFVAQLAELNFERVTLVVEPTGTYSDALVYQAQQAGLHVVRINGNRTHKARAVFDGIPSMHDGKAAYVLARLYLCGVGTPWKLRSEADRDLRALDDQMREIIKMESQMVGRFEARLARHWPDVTRHLDLKSATLLELILAFGSAREVAANRKEAAALMRETGGHFLKDKKIEDVLRSAEENTGVPPGAHEVELLKYHATMLRTHQKNYRRLRSNIEEVALQDERTRSLAPLTGKGTAVSFVGQLGDFKDYDAPEALENAFGLTLCENTTGQTRQDKRGHDHKLHISKRGPGRSRGLLFMLALRFLSPTSKYHCPVATAWYAERLRQNGGVKMKAIIALMRKIVRALYWVARGHEYDAEKLFDTARLRRLGHLP